MHGQHDKHIASELGLKEESLADVTVLFQGIRVQHLIEMTSWTHLICFLPVAEDNICLGQLVDTTRDIGQDFLNGIPIFAFRIEGSIFDGRVTAERLQVKQVRFLNLNFQSPKV